MLRILLLSLAVVILAVVAVVAVGWRLPVHHLSSRERTFSASPDTLFALISHPASYPRWRRGVQRVDLLPASDGHEQFREFGKNEVILYSIERATPGRELVTRIADPTLPFGGSWTYELLPASGGTGTTLRITENGEVYNPMFRFVSRYVTGETATIDAYLDDVAKQLGRQ